MKIYFIRNTHDENGNYRGDEYFGKYDSTKDLPFGVHVWGHSGEKLTFDDVYKRIVEMYNGGASDGIPMEMPNDDKHTVEAFLKGLAYMIKKKLVIVQIEL
jgi:hypothetical protein